MKIYILRDKHGFIVPHKTMCDVKKLMLEDFNNRFNKKNLPFTYSEVKTDNVIEITFKWGKFNILRQTYYINIYNI